MGLSDPPAQTISGLFNSTLSRSYQDVSCVRLHLSSAHFYFTASLSLTLSYTHRLIHTSYLRSCNRTSLLLFHDAANAQRHLCYGDGSYRSMSFTHLDVCSPPTFLPRQVYVSLDGLKMSASACDIIFVPAKPSPSYHR